MRFRNVGISLVLAAATVSWAAAASASDLAPATEETVFFRGWQYKTHIVQDNVDIYNNAVGGHVDYATVTGDYPAIMEKQLIAGAELDILYANVSQAARYFDGGWLTPASKLPNAEVILADLYPNIRDAWTYKGELLGLSYFTSVRGLPLVNLQKYYELGYTDADFPANWDALYDQIHEMPAKGIDQPYLPMWFNEWYGISWSFLFEVMNRGGQVADGETHEPMLTVDGPGGETLRDWKAAWNAGLIPKEVLSMKNSNNTEAFASGRFVFSPQAMYDLETFNNPERSQIPGHVTLLPYQGQSWGLLDSAMYLMTSRDRSDEHTADVMRFVNWYGYQNHEGKVFVADRWINDSMLFSGYRSVMESPEAKEAITKALARPEDYQVVLDVYSATPYPKGVWSVVWAPEFNSWLKEGLEVFVLEDQDVGEAIEEINEKIADLNKKYGL
jgi:multiple sugar transport system substrate-binding protein